MILTALIQSLAISQMTERDTVFKRFRSVSIQNNLAITLQSNIKDLKDITIKSSNDHYYLKKGSFIRADSIDIETNKKGLIIAITFVYPGTDYQSMQKTYTKPLGKGKEYVYASEEFRIDVTQWNDEKTIFELVKLVTEKSIMIYSVITDKKLYNEKVKNRFDIYKSAGPLEIVKRLAFN